MTVTVIAPAKVNLYLHVTGRRPDGYHRLDSLVAFADIGDRLTAAPAQRLSLVIDGPETAGIADLPPESNLVLRAAVALAITAGIEPGATLRLEKHLPVAAGIGGGSSDAAAALIALTRLWNLPFDRRRLARIGAGLGADVPACLMRRPVWVGGIGERLAPTPPLPAVGVLLVNPRRPLPTAAVFRARRGRFSTPDRFTMPKTAAGLAHSLEARGNDLTEPAISLIPEIAEVLAELSRLPQMLLAHMSGSGATCFALFEGRDAAGRAARILAARRPNWWCAPAAIAVHG